MENAFSFDINTIISTISLVIAGIAYNISRKQYKVDEYKRQDFMFERRFAFYEKLREITLLMLAEHTKENSRKNMSKGLYPELTDLINMSVFLFNQDITNFLMETDIKIRQFYRLHKVDPEKEQKNDEEILRFFYECGHGDKLIQLFKPYFS